MEDQSVVIDEYLIAQATSLQREGRNFYRDRKVSKEAIDRYPETDKEKKCLVKLSKTYYPPRAFVKPWREVLFVIMCYITLDGRFTKVYSYHFVLLNHYRHDEKVNFPYFLLRSMNATIKAYKENPMGDTAMHQGLMVLIYDHLKSNQIVCPQPSIESKEDGSDSIFSIDEGSNSDPTSDSEESLDDSEFKIGKKRKYMQTRPSSSKGKKPKGKILQISSSSEEEVSKDSEKEKPQGFLKKKTKVHT